MRAWTFAWDVLQLLVIGWGCDFYRRFTQDVGIVVHRKTIMLIGPQKANANWPRAYHRGKPLDAVETEDLLRFLAS